MTNREIDALVAEKVMGLQGVTNRLLGLGVFRLEYGAGDTDEKVPAYSTDPAASKQLRDKMLELGWSYQIGYGKTNIESSAGWKITRGFECRLVNMEADVTRVSATADTEELAVALAALEAVGVEVDRP